MIEKHLPKDATCKNCSYSLHGLLKHRCPECGEPFDPDDENTFTLPLAKNPLTILQLSLVFSGLNLSAILISILCCTFFGLNTIENPAFLVMDTLMLPLSWLFNLGNPHNLNPGGFFCFTQ